MAEAKRPAKKRTSKSTANKADPAKTSEDIPAPDKGVTASASKPEEGQQKPVIAGGAPATPGTGDPTKDTSAAKTADSAPKGKAVKGADVSKPASAGTSVPASGRAKSASSAAPGDTDKPGSDASGSTPPSASPPPARDTAPVVQRRGGFFPMLLGGILAAGIGFAAAQYLGPDAWPFDDGRASLRTDVEDALAVQRGTDDELAQRIEELSARLAADDGSARLDEFAGVLDGVENRLGGLVESVNVLEQRLVALEKRPISEGVSQEAIAAYERELQALQDRMAEQRAEVEALAAEAEQERAAAQKVSVDTTRQAALTQIRAAIEGGTPFQSAIDTLHETGTEVPAALSDAADGVATLAELQADFPERAREALDASRGDAGEDGITGFLRQQLGARSLTAREGDDPDAILSRAESELRAGRLDAALEEIATLPDAARAPLDDWILRANRRNDALQAVTDLSQQTNSN